jgi:RHS repeat-associated protein
LAGGRRIARRDIAGGAQHYYFTDHLGSTDVVTTSTGVLENDSAYYPYGAERAYTTNLVDQNYKFNGKERDIESQLDEFGARYYANAQGRFMIPDWAEKPTAVPYANFGNPQSLNLYSYVQNNPTTLGDPDGHDFNEFMNGLTNAWGSDNLLGYGRQEQSTLSGKIGAAVGDGLATVQGGAEALLGGGAAVGGGTEAVLTSPLALTGVGTLVPAAGVGTALVGAVAVVHGSATAGTAVKNLTFSKRVGDFTSGEKQQMDSENADKNGGTIKCTECGQEVQKVPNKKGEKAPGNQIARHHDPLLSEGGSSKSSKNRIVCRDCHVKIHTKKPDEVRH